MRLFIGLDLPPDIKKHIHEYLNPIKLSEKGWENPHDYHQTLLFIGESSEEECSEIERRLSQINFQPFHLTLGSFKFFPRRVMYITFEESAELIELKNQVAKLFPEWENKSSKPFTPHVTVKRFQRYEHAHLASSLAEGRFDPKKFLVNSICLFKSEKDSLNRKYHVISEKVFNF